MRALFDRVLIETVGVGQSETDVAGVADTVVFCVQPGSGDSLQFMKAGIVEIPHLIVVTKADLGAAAERARADVAGALSLAEAARGDWTIPVLSLSVQQRQGVADLIEALDKHADWLTTSGRLDPTSRPGGNMAGRIGSRALRPRGQPPGRPPYPAPRHTPLRPTPRDIAAVALRRRKRACKTPEAVPRGFPSFARRVCRSPGRSWLSMI